MFEPIAHPDLLAARWQMALSLGWHIIIACFGLGLVSLLGAALVLPALAWLYILFQRAPGKSP